MAEISVSPSRAAAQAPRVRVKKCVAPEITRVLPARADGVMWAVENRVRPANAAIMMKVRRKYPYRVRTATGEMYHILIKYITYNLIYIII